MELPVNKFKHALQAGKPQIGIWSSLSSHIVAEVLSNSGFDWVLLDTEHSPNELPMVQSQLHAMQGGSATPVVRVAWNDMVMVKRTLDIGAQSLLVPYVQSVEEAKSAVAYMRYPPHGVRGVAGATRDGVDGVFIGPNDLSTDMGYFGNWQHPEVWKVMEEAAKKIRAAGKAPGILVGEADGKRCLDMGYLFVAVGADVGMLARGSEAPAAKFTKGCPR